MAKQKFEPLFELYGKASYFDDLDLLNNEKTKEKLIKNIEAIIRTSQEYRNYIRYLKTDAELNYCTLMNILPEDIAKHIKIEMHHFPFTLYDLVDIILVKAVSLGEDFSRLSIANEVMEAHFNNQIGLVPLTVTAHQMMHNGHYFIHKEEVFGDYEKFFDRYKPYLTDDHYEKITRLRKTTKDAVLHRKRLALEVKEELYIDYDDKDMEIVALPAPPLEDDEDAPMENPLVTASKNNKPQEASFEAIEIEDNDDHLDEDEEDDIIELDEDENDIKLTTPKTVNKTIPSIKKRKSLSDEFGDDE